MRTSRALLGVAIALVVAAVIATVTWLVLTDGGEANDRGSCAGATYELEAEREDDALEISFELQSAAPGETWAVRIAQGGEILLEGERQTDGDAEIDVDVYAPRDGEPRFTATATQGGDVCSASITTG